MGMTANTPRILRKQENSKASPQEVIHNNLLLTTYLIYLVPCSVAEVNSVGNLNPKDRILILNCNLISLMSILACNRRFRLMEKTSV